MRISVLYALALLLIGASSVATAADRREFVCKSVDFRYQVCPIGGTAEVRLVKQLSDASCKRGRTWGRDRRGVWVDQGCSARFVVEKRGGGDYHQHGKPRPPGQGGGGWSNSSSSVLPADAKELVCRSRNFNYRLCRIARAGETRVQLTEQLSDNPCRRGRNWGRNRDGVWVDDGCAARFKVVRDRRGDAGQREVRCASADFRYRYCKTPTDGRVSLVSQLSDARCIKDRTWGFDRGGIWVDEGCAARFRVGGSYRRH